MLNELLTMLSTVDINAKGKGLRNKFNVNLNRNHIRSISAYSSNSIFYFRTMVSDQITPEEMTMCTRFLEKSYASFVVACIGLMPFHRVRADDQAAIEDYLKQFHQNMGISDGGNAAMRRIFDLTDAMIGKQNESAGLNYTVEELQETQSMLQECWNRSRRDGTDFIEEVTDVVPLHEMYNKDAVDATTRVLQENYRRTLDELETWGFLGEATATMFDGSGDAFLGTDDDLDDDLGYGLDDDEDLESLMDDEDFDDLLEDEWEDDALVEGVIAKKINGSDGLWNKYFAEAKRDGKGDEVAQSYASRKVQEIKDAVKRNKELFKAKSRERKLRKTIEDNKTKKPGKMLYGEDSRVRSVKGDPRHRVQESMQRLQMAAGVLDESAIILDESKSFGERFGALKQSYQKMLGHKVENHRIRGALGTVKTNWQLSGLTGKGGVIGAARTDDDLDQLEAFLMDRHQTGSWISKADPKGFYDDTYELLDYVKDRRQMLKQLGRGSGQSSLGDDVWSTLAAERAKRDAAMTEAEKLELQKRQVEAGEDLSRAAKIQAGASVVGAGTYAYETLRPKGMFENATMTEGTVRTAINSIMFTLEGVSENKIKSCGSLVKLAQLESKLNKLKGKYAEYLNRYKRKYKENLKNGTNQKLAIKFNGMEISDPRAFMQQYGQYIKVINRRLKMVEARRSELRAAKGLPDTGADKKLEEAGLPVITEADFEALDYCLRSIDEALDAPDSKIFSILDEAGPLDTIKDATKIAGNAGTLVGQILDLNDRISGTGKFASRDDTDHWYDEHPNIVTPAMDRNGQAIPPAPRVGPTYEKIRNRNNLNVAAAAGRSASGYVKMDTFGNSVFTDMDMKKANEAIPTFAHASIGFIVDETEQVVQRDVLIGIKVYLHRVPAKDLVDDVYNAIMSKRKFLKFVKWVSGEEKSLADLIFGFKELKLDAVNTRKPGMGPWLSTMRSRARMSKFSVPYLMQNYTPNGTVVLTMNEVSYLKNEYGLDIMRSDHVKLLMDQNFLLGFVVIDQANETVHISYDGHNGSFETYPYAAMEREQRDTDRMLRQLYQSMSR